MIESAEYQYLNQMLQSNRYLESMMESDIAQLLQIVQQKRQTIKEIRALNEDLTAKINSIGQNGDLVLVNYSPFLPIGE